MRFPWQPQPCDCGSNDLKLYILAIINVVLCLGLFYAIDKYCFWRDIAERQKQKIKELNSSLDEKPGDK